MKYFSIVILLLASYIFAIDINVKNAKLSDVVKLISKSTQKQIILKRNINNKISLELHNITLDELLTLLAKRYGLVVKKNNNKIFLLPKSTIVKTQKIRVTNISSKNIKTLASKCPYVKLRLNTNNELIIRGNSQNIRKALNIIKKFDKSPLLLNIKIKAVKIKKNLLNNFTVKNFKDLNKFKNDFIIIDKINIKTTSEKRTKFKLMKKNLIITANTRPNNTLMVYIKPQNNPALNEVITKITIGKPSIIWNFVTSEQKRKTKKIPVLGYIPIIGELFSSETIYDVYYEVFVVILINIQDKL